MEVSGVLGNIERGQTDGHLQKQRTDRGPNHMESHEREASFT